MGCSVFEQLVGCYDETDLKDHITFSKDRNRLVKI